MRLRGRWQAALGLSVLLHIVAIAAIVSLGPDRLDQLGVPGEQGSTPDSSAGREREAAVGSARSSHAVRLLPRTGGTEAPSAVPPPSSPPATEARPLSIDGEIARRSERQGTGEAVGSESQAAGSPSGDGKPEAAGSAAAGNEIAGKNATGAPGSTASTGSKASAEGAGSGSADLRATLHSRLQTAAQSCYPEAERRFRISGRVVLAFCLTGTGGTREVRIAQSSGRRALDAAAEQCVLERARPLPTGSGCFEVPLLFGT